MARLSQMALLAAVCACMALLPQAAAQTIKSPNKFYGFELPVPFYNYWNYTVDIGEMKGLMAQDKFTEAASIYYQGKNNLRNATVVRYMAGLTAANFSGEGPSSWWGKYTSFYNSPTYLKQLIEPPLNGTSMTCCGMRDATLQVYFRLWQMAFSQHEVDAGVAYKASEEAGHGFAVVASPMDRKNNYWNWVEANSRAACIPKVRDPKTNMMAAPAMVAYRTAIEEMVPAIDEEDIDLRGQRTKEVKAKLEKVITIQFMQSLMVNARRSKTPNVAKASACWKDCTAQAYQAGAIAAWKSIGPLVAASGQAELIATLTTQLSSPDPKAAFAGIASNMEALAAALGIDFKTEVWACTR